MKKLFATLAISAFMVSMAFGTAMAQMGQSGTATQPGMSGQQGTTQDRNMSREQRDQTGQTGQTGMQGQTMTVPQNWAKDANKGSKIIGSTVQDSAGNKIGSVHDLMVDTHSGRTPFFVLDHDGKYSAVPMQYLRYSDKDHNFIINMDKAQIAQLPTFDKNNWPSLSDRSWSSSVYRYYGMRPYWEESTTR
jgi:sporulation protein YlmC with PRC-barrel domain